MKKIILLLLIVVSNVGLMASEYSGFSMKVISRENQNINGSFFFFVKITFNDSIKFHQSLELVLPPNWSYSTNKNITKKYYSVQDTLNIKVIVNYPTSQIPFYATRIQIKESGDSKTVEQEIQRSITSMIYFTPYNSVEIWNMTDYYDLPRKWLEPDTNSTTQPQRISFKKNKIPRSDLINKPENWLEDNKDLFYGECREVEVIGLGYNVLMSPVPIDSVSFYEQIGDGQDSVNTNKSLWKTFDGSVNGRLTANIINDLGQEIIIPLVGIRVKLMEKDLFYSQEFGSAYTDENGNFSISYSKSQFNEGQCVELYLRYKSETSDYNITSSNIIGNRYEHDSGQWSAQDGEYNQNAGTTTLTMRTWTDVKNEAFTGIHWARKGYKYFFNNLVPLNYNLRVKINASGSWFDPDLVSLKPCIHLQANDGNRENTIYHEFGHFVMYCIQNKNFTVPYGENGFNHSWSHENTSLLAFVEGWADAIGMILDAANWTDDGEYGTDEGWENIFYFEDRHHWSNPNTWNINNGFRSEYYIACAIYDLWDGPQKNLPNIIPFNPNVFHQTLHGWNDSGQGSTGWKTVDNVEFTLKEICQPLIDHQSGDGGYLFNGKCKNIQDYYKYLMENFDFFCDKKSDITRCFKENRLQWNIAEYEWGWHATNISPDFIRQTETKLENPSSILISNWTDYYLVRFYNKNSFNEFRYSAYPSEDLQISDDLYLGIWDTYSNVFRQSDLYINDAIRPDYTGYSSIDGTYTTCGNVVIDVRNGKLEIGGTSTTATLIIKDGSELHIRNHGQLIIHDNSTLIIECGARLVYDDGANVQLLGNNSTILVYGDFVTGASNIYNFNGPGTLFLYQTPTLTAPFGSNNSFTVASGSNIHFVASDNIILKPGFHAMNGSVFHAFIDPTLQECNSTKSLIVNNLSGNTPIIELPNEEIAYQDSKAEIRNIPISIIAKTKLIGNFPNPTTNSTTIKYRVEKEELLSIFITDQYGHKLIDLINDKNHQVGDYEVTFNLSPLNSGVYFYSLKTNDCIQTKMLLKQ